MAFMGMLPSVSSSKIKQDLQTAFRGYYNHPAAAGDMFVDERNMSSDEYPILTQRKTRRVIRTFEKATGACGGDVMVWFDGVSLYVDGKKVCELAPGEKTILRMAAYVVVWPDKVMYNTYTGELTNIEQHKTVTGAEVRPCMLSGQEYEYVASDTEPTSKANGTYWLNTQTNGFYQYLGGEWQGIDTVYTRIEATGLGDEIAEYDVVNLSGFSVDALNIEGATVYARGDHYIVIATGEILNYTEQGETHLDRNAPDMDFMVESGNRLFGCSNKTHEIYACKLGDPTNWYSYLGISTDSYAATVGSNGDFTGACKYLGYPLFMKENCIHRIYGTRPANFQIVELPVRGVQAGCAKSICIVREMLYYMARGGMVAFDGSTVSDVGAALGQAELTEVICGAHKQKLYVSALADGEERLFVLDTLQGLWHLEDETRAEFFVNTPEGDFFIADNKLVSIDGVHSKYEDETAADEESFTWNAVTGDILMEKPNRQWLKRLMLRVSMERGAEMSVDVMFDSSGKWERVATAQSQLKRAISLPLRMRRCDHFALRFSGQGAVRIYDLSKMYELGSERECSTFRA